MVPGSTSVCAVITTITVQVANVIFLLTLCSISCEMFMCTELTGP